MPKTRRTPEQEARVRFVRGWEAGYEAALQFFQLEQPSLAEPDDDGRSLVSAALDHRDEVVADIRRILLD